MINWDYMITYGGPELFMVFIIVIVTPFLYWLILKRFKLVVKIISVLSLWIFAVFISYWDVYQIAKKAERLCRDEAGMHVYKTVEAEGFLGYATDIEQWSEYGFSYVEGRYKNKKTRLSIKDGEVIRETVPKYISLYQYTGDSEVLEEPFVKTKDLIKVRKTNEILGEVIAFKVYPGWLDSRLLGILGFSWTPPRCDGNYKPEPGKSTIYLRDFIKAVLKPKKIK